MPHINEHIDFVVTAFIVYEDKVLLVFHKQLQKWLPVGGHIELDEDPEQALFREIQEDIKSYAREALRQAQGKPFKRAKL